MHLRENAVNYSDKTVKWESINGMQEGKEKETGNGHTVEVTAVGSVSLHHAGLHHHHPHICKNPVRSARTRACECKWIDIVHTRGGAEKERKKKKLKRKVNRQALFTERFLFSNATVAEFLRARP